MISRDWPRLSLTKRKTTSHLLSSHLKAPVSSHRDLRRLPLDRSLSSLPLAHNCPPPWLSMTNLFIQHHLTGTYAHIPESNTLLPPTSLHRLLTSLEISIVTIQWSLRQARIIFQTVQAHSGLDNLLEHSPASSLTRPPSIISRLGGTTVLTLAFTTSFVTNQTTPRTPLHNSSGERLRRRRVVSAPLLHRSGLNVTVSIVSRPKWRRRLSSCTPWGSPYRFGG